MGLPKSIRTSSSDTTERLMITRRATKNGPEGFPSGPYSAAPGEAAVQRACDQLTVMLPLG